MRGREDDWEEDWRGKEEKIDQKRRKRMEEESIVYNNIR